MVPAPCVWPSAAEPSAAATAFASAKVPASTACSASGCSSVPATVAATFAAYDRFALGVSRRSDSLDASIPLMSEQRLLDVHEVRSHIT